MSEKTAEERTLEDLRAFVTMPEFERTIGAWLKRIESDSIYIAMSESGEQPEKIHFARGQYSAAKQIIDTIEVVTTQGEAARKRRLSKR